MLNIKILCGTLILVPTLLSASAVSRNNYVDWVLASAKASSDSHFIQWENSLSLPDHCKTVSGSYRTRLSSNDKDLLALLLVAKVTNSKVGFYYDTSTTTGSVPGHGSDCQLVNAWIESD